MAESKSYTSRDVVAIRQDMINRVPQLTDKWRDFNESDLGMVLIELMAGSQDMQNYYFDTQTFETYLDTAQQPKNIRSLCRAMNYRIPLIGSAHGTVTIEYPEAQQIDAFYNDELSEEELEELGVGTDDILEIEREVVIPKYTQFTSSMGGLVYVTLKDYSQTITGGRAYVEVIEGTIRETRITKRELSNNITPVGNVSRRIYLSFDNVADGTVEVLQDGEVWEECEDALLKYDGGRYFSVHRDSSGMVYVFMSVNFMDLLPEDDEEELIIRYITSNGTSGNVDSMYIDTPVPSSGFNTSDIVKAYNLYPTYGSWDDPELQSQKIKARLKAMTMDRFITLEDYKIGVMQLPYVMKFMVVDWKTLEYCKEPYVVMVYAVGWDGEDLGVGDKQDMIRYLESKGVATIEVRAQYVDIIRFGIDIEVGVITSNSDEKEQIMIEIQEFLENNYGEKALNFGDSISIAMLASQIRVLHPKIKSCVVRSPEDDLILLATQFPKLEDVTITLNETR